MNDQVDGVVTARMNTVDGVVERERQIDERAARGGGLHRSRKDTRDRRETSDGLVVRDRAHVVEHERHRHGVGIRENRRDDENRCQKRKTRTRTLRTCRICRTLIEPFEPVEPFEPSNPSNPLPLASSLRLGHRKIPFGIRKSGLQRQGALEFGDGAVDVALGSDRDSEIVVSFRRLRGDAQGGAKFDNRIIEAAGVEQRAAEVVVRRRVVRVELGGTLEFRECLGRVSGARERIGQVAVRFGRARLGGDRRAKGCNRIIAFARGGERDAEIVPDAGGIGNRLQGDPEMFFRFLRFFLSSSAFARL